MWIRDCFWPTLLLAAGIPCPSIGSAQEEVPAEVAFADEPEATALYDRMVEVMQEARTLSWTASFHTETPQGVYGRGTYRIELEKPNYFRMEGRREKAENVSGVLIGDGEDLWVHWPDGKPQYQWEREGDYLAEYEEHKYSFYMTKPTPPGVHSIGHEAGRLGAGLGMTIIDASTFHGYSDSMQPYFDGARSLGVEEVRGEECDLIEVSFMKHQRSWYLWLSRRDHLPRELKEVIRVSYDIVKFESWSDVVIDAEIADDRFAWSPPEDWVQWDFPPIEEGLLKPGTPAPDFEGPTLDGRTARLSDYRGNFVWLNKWRCG